MNRQMAKKAQRKGEECVLGLAHFRALHGKEDQNIKSGESKQALDRGSRCRRAN